MFVPRCRAWLAGRATGLQALRRWHITDHTISLLDRVARVAHRLFRRGMGLREGRGDSLVVVVVEADRRKSATRLALAALAALAR